MLILPFQIPIVSDVCNLMLSTDSLLFPPGSLVHITTAPDKSDWFEWVDYEICS